MGHTETRLRLPAGWRAWAGVSGVLYARRPGTSPPMVARARDWAVLVARAWEREDRGRRS